MKVWTLTYNDDNSSPYCAVFTSREAMEQAKEEWVQGHQYDYPDVDFDQPVDDILQDLYDQTFFMDNITEQEHVLTPPTSLN